MRNKLKKNYISYYKCFENSSKRIRSRFMDQYSQAARKENLRSRSWFKLQSLDRTDSLFRKGMIVVDLGSSPGGWSSYAIKKISNKGNIMACDILPMRAIPGVDFLQEDCSDPSFSEKVLLWSRRRYVQIVLSDMSPKTTGISVIDVCNSIYLGNIALNVCRHVLEFGGTFLVKIFQGKGFEQYLYDITGLFYTVKIRKPNSSRSNSREVYVVAKNFRYKIIDI